MEIFVITAPGLEDLLTKEAREKGFKVAQVLPGGVTLIGDWAAVWRANLQLRGAARVLARLGQFRAVHLSQLDKQARAFPWEETLPMGARVHVDTVCRKSKIYHAGAATQRIEAALTAQGFRLDPDAPFQIKGRIEQNIVTLSLDTSGAPLHKRGHKEAVNAAPLRETMAALFLREAGFNGKEPVYDPMCGSGTFLLEAAEIARRLDPGRARNFAFQALPNFDAETFASMASPPRTALHPVFGSDRDAGAVAMATSNIVRAGLDETATVTQATISEITPPTETPGLIVTNPPYGTRIGNKGPLFALYASFGARLKQEFSGWRVAFITTDEKLARATDLPLLSPGPPVAHGGLKVRLWQTDALP